VNPPGGRNRGRLRHVMRYPDGHITLCNIHMLQGPLPISHPVPESMLNAH
jgi:hypothetical protein